jgi:hypothetical protein
MAEGSQPKYRGEKQPEQREQEMHHGFEWFSSPEGARVAEKLEDQSAGPKNEKTQRYSVPKRGG